MRPRVPLLAVGAAAAFALGAIPANAQAPSPQVLRGNDVVAGRTVRAWTAPMAKWAVERSRPEDCQAGQGGRMFFLPSSSGGAFRAECAVAVGTPVMILAAGIICWDADTKGDEARVCLAPARRRSVVQVGAKVDGVPVKFRPRDWIGRHGFQVDGTRGATAGYYLVLDGLAAGRHEIVLFARFERDVIFRARTTISLTVR